MGRPNRSRCCSTCAPATSSRRPSRTGSRSSCRWGCTSSSRRSSINGDRRNRSRSTSRRLRTPTRATAPQPERALAGPRGGWLLGSTSTRWRIAFFVLFLASWALHAAGGVAPSTRSRSSTASRPISVWQLRHHRPVLVRVDPELAERIPRGRGHHRRCRSSCGSEGRPNRSRSPTRIREPARDYPVRLGRTVVARMPNQQGSPGGV